MTIAGSCLYAKFFWMNCRHQHLIRSISLILALVSGCVGGVAAVINVTTNDSYTKIEGANPGDTVIIAPGTYAFRVYLTKIATPASPIVIQALDPSNPPVWDFGTNLVENAPGSYTAGDRGRGGWQFSGAHSYDISGIVFRHCRTASYNSAGIRFFNGTTNLCIKNCVFDHNDDGLTGGTQNSQAVVEFCEFNANGNTNASLSSPTHNIYVYGGYLTTRHCYVHDSAQAQNFHIRCRSVTLEWNWFARAANYEGDLMTDDDFSGAGPFSQTLTLRGNVLVQNQQPGNHSQVIAIYNDAGLTNLTLSLHALYNTFVGVNTNSAFVHVSNADGTQMAAEISDNIIYGTKTIGAANASVFGLPGREYYLNELTNRSWRIRAAARDLGAFESTSTNSPVGPYDQAPLPQVDIQRSGTNTVVTWPLFAQDFQLYQSDLSSPITWSLAPVSYTTNALGVLATVPVGTGRSFFRLKK